MTPPLEDLYASRMGWITRGAVPGAPGLGSVRVVAIDDHEAVRAGMERVLTGSPGFISVAALADARDLFRLLQRERVDVVVLDYDLDRTDGLSLCLRIKERREPPAVVIYSGYAAPALMLGATVAQADAVLHKAEPVEVLLGSLRRLANGARLIAAPAPDLLQAATARLDAQDVPVMALLVDGTRPGDIARALALEEDEVVRRAQRIVGVLQACRPRRRPLKSV